LALFPHQFVDSIGSTNHCEVTMEGPDVERDFDRAMVGIYTTAKRELGYSATRFIQMVSDRGGVAAARQLLHSSTVSDGFVTLWEARRLDLSVEAHVLMERYATLFTEDERRIAAARLAEYGYRP
jgi:hypothetical protein